MTNQGKWILGCTAALFFHTGAWAEENAADDQQAVRVQLEQAKVVLIEAEKTAEEIIRKAHSEADRIGAESDLSPLLVQNGRVSIEINGGTIEDIVTAIMPSHWRVLVDVKDTDIRERRFQFVSTRTREQALNDLLKPIGMKHQYFFDLKDAGGEASPLLVVSADK